MGPRGAGGACILQGLPLPSPPRSTHFLPPFLFTCPRRGENLHSLLFSAPQGPWPRSDLS